MKTSKRYLLDGSIRKFGRAFPLITYVKTITLSYRIFDDSDSESEIRQDGRLSVDYAAVMAGVTFKKSGKLGSLRKRTNGTAHYITQYNSNL